MAGYGYTPCTALPARPPHPERGVSFEHSLPVLTLIMGAFFLGGLVKGTVGLGLPIVVLAVLASVLDLVHVLPLLIVPTIVLNFWQMLAGPSLWGLVRRLWPFLAPAAVTIWFGIGILAGTEGEAMKAVLGVLLCVYSAVTLFAPRLPPPGRHERWMSPVMGGTGGLMFGMAGIFIIPAILYLETLRMPRDEFVQALGLTFVVISVAMTVALAGRNLVGAEQAVLTVVALVPSALGLIAGRKLRGLTDESTFRRMFFIALFAVGVSMILRAI